jgi:hypothetical protein
MWTIVEGVVSELPEGDNAPLVALQVDDVAVEGIGHGRVLGNLAWEDRGPELHESRAELLLCFRRDGCRGDGCGGRKRAEDRGQAEEVIGMAVGDADRREVLPSGADPLHDPAGVLGGEGGSLSSSEVLQRHLGTAHVVKVFNKHHLLAPRLAGPPGRRGRP